MEAMECFIGLVWLVTALLTVEIYRQKELGTGWGILVGFMLGPLGLIAALVRASHQPQKRI